MDRESALIKGLENKKKAYYAMCRASLVLFASAFLSRVANYFIVMYSPSIVSDMQAITVAFLTFFGVGKAAAFSAARMLFSSAAVYSLTDMAITMFMLALPAYIFSKCVRLEQEECFNVKGKIVKGLVFAFCLVQLLTVTVSVFSQNLMEFILPGIYDYDFSYAQLGDGFDVFAFVMEIISACIVVGVVEELVFRGVLLSYLRRYGTVFAVVASSVTFGIAHSSPVQSVYAFVFGIMAAFFTVITGNLKTAIMLHALNNAVMVVLQHLPLIVGQDNFDVMYLVYMAVVFAFAFAGLYMLVKKGGYAELFFEKSDGHDKTLAVKAGIREIITFPVALYIVFYAATYIFSVLG